MSLSPLDDRYSGVTSPIRTHFSNRELQRLRAHVEIQYLIALVRELKWSLNGWSLDKIRDMMNGFDVDDVKAIEDLEKTTTHDVKAVELWLRQRLQSFVPAGHLSMIHFALTSQDVTNPALSIMLKHTNKVMIDAVDQLQYVMTRRVVVMKNMPLLARTHGQPASPTTMGKEWDVFAERIMLQMVTLKTIPIMTKFGGATGNFNAHRIAYPDHDWPKFADRFIDSLGLNRLSLTTQIDTYDYQAQLFDAWRRVATILIDFCQDIWLYISRDYFTQAIEEKEVGSSTMPHKLMNPIQFEKAEGNLGLARALFTHLSDNLPISRLQRDLTDSTVTRNIGTAFGHMYLAVTSILNGIERLVPRPEVMCRELLGHWEVLGEAVQTIMRREGVPDAYDQVKRLSRVGHAMSKDDYAIMVAGLTGISDHVRSELMKLSPLSYLGYASD